jgi:hypothetical protein
LLTLSEQGFFAAAFGHGFFAQQGFLQWGKHAFFAQHGFLQWGGHAFLAQHGFLQ